LTGLCGLHGLFVALETNGLLARAALFVEWATLQKKRPLNERPFLCVVGDLSSRRGSTK
jgi:hypothetical protein